MLRKLALTFITSIGVGTALAETDSRLNAIALSQNEKAERVTPEHQPKIERALIWVRDSAMIERFSSGVGGGFGARLGGLVAGSGFAAGPGYQTTNGPLTLRFGAQASTRGYRKLDVAVAGPNISQGRFFTELYAVHHDYPSLSYYGPGADSQKTGRTNFRLEDTAVDATFGGRPVKHLSIGASVGYSFNNVGPGTDSRYASTEAVYSPDQAPGIDDQKNYLRTGAFAQYDWRDNPGGPRRGGNYFVQFSDYRSFRRIDLEAQQFISVLNARRVFALRARSTMTSASKNEVLPFYMQPSLGGSDDLRGYRPFRFRDANLFVMTAEYRWEIFSGLDMALFSDAGKVYKHKSDFSLREIESDVGFGFRFNNHNQTFLRVDVGFSHEGFQVWVRFADIFKRGLQHTSSSMGAM